MTQQLSRSNRCSSIIVLLIFAATWVLTLAPAFAQEENPYAKGNGLMWLVSPMAGYNRNELKQKDRTGQTMTKAKTAPEYGLFALVAHPRFVVNNFLFLTEAADDTDLVGNFFHANLYGDPDAAATWNVGAGHLYHKIKPQVGDIEVSVPLVKAGLVLRYKPWGLTFNPHVGYGWERVDAVIHVPPRDRQVHTKNDSYIAGLTVDWRWRMVGANVKYHYQDSQDSSDNFNSLHVLLTTGITRNWGAAIRYDHMEYSSMDDTSILVGPVCVF